MIPWACLVAQKIERICLQCGTPRFDLWVVKIAQKRAWLPTPVYLPGDFLWTEEPGGLQSMGLQKVRYN